MTYGWVLLAIMVVLVVLWQWGLFTVNQRVEPGSFGFWGVSIMQGTEFILRSDGQLQVSVFNMVGANVTIMSYNATIDRRSKTVTCESDCVIAPGKSKVLELSDSLWAEAPGKRFESSMVILYKDERTGENVYQSSGRMWGSIEPT